MRKRPSRSRQRFRNLRRVLALIWTILTTWWMAMWWMFPGPLPEPLPWQELLLALLGPPLGLAILFAFVVLVAEEFT